MEKIKEIARELARAELALETALQEAKDAAERAELAKGDIVRLDRAFVEAIRDASGGNSGADSNNAPSRINDAAAVLQPSVVETLKSMQSLGGTSNLKELAKLHHVTEGNIAGRLWKAKNAGFVKRNGKRGSYMLVP